MILTNLFSAKVSTYLVNVYFFTNPAVTMNLSGVKSANQIQYVTYYILTYLILK